MSVTNFMQLLVLIENQLGWEGLNPERPLVKQRVAMAGRLKRAAAANPKLLTLPNLELTVHWLHRRREHLKSPIGVVHFVEQALKEIGAEKQVRRPYLELINEAIQLERQHQQVGHEDWESRLFRAHGSYREVAYNEWLTERGHQWVS